MGSSGFRPLGTLARITAVGLAAAGLVTLSEAATLAFGVDWFAVLLGAGGFHGIDASHLMTYLTAVVFLMWLTRAHKNLNTFGEDLRGYGTVVVWFVPVVNLWMPYHVVREIWHKSGPPRTAEPTAWFLRAWWACWVGSSLVPIGEALFDIGGLVILGKLLKVAAAGLAIAVVFDLSERQLRRGVSGAPATF